VKATLTVSEGGVSEIRNICAEKICESGLQIKLAILDNKVGELSKRIDRLVTTIDKSKSVRGI